MKIKSQKENEMSVGFKFSLIPFPLKKADVIGHVFTPYSSGDLASN